VREVLTARVNVLASGSSGGPTEAKNVLLAGMSRTATHSNQSSSGTMRCQLIYAANVRAGLSGEFRRALLPHFEAFQIARCPFSNVPDRTEGRWGEGLTTARMSACRWLDPFLVARIEFLEWTLDNRLRHPRFAGIRSDKDATEVMRE